MTPVPTSLRRGAVLAAAVLLLLALGLPWSASTQEYVPGWFNAGLCTPNLYDGTISCTGSYASPGMYVGSPASPGAETVARVFLVGALALIVLARRQDRPLWLSVAGGAVLLGILLTGPAAQGGQLTALAAVGLLLYAGLAGREGARRTGRTPGGRVTG